jgi:CRISPR-associated protein Cas6
VTDETYVDLAFPTDGGRVPLDHGYPLYAALSATLPELHEAPWLGVHPLSGTPESDALTLTPRSRLTLRSPLSQVARLLPLAGQTLSISGARVRLRAPQIFQLETRACLDARLVLIRLTDAVLPTNEVVAESVFARRFQEEAQRQLERIGIRGQLTLHGQRRITVAGRRLLGFSARVDGLQADESLSLQVHGLGGKRRMGCGIFRPTRVPTRDEGRSVA